jgi:hypothetical protein
VAKPGSGWKAAVEATLSTAPVPCCTIRGRKAPVSSCTASTLTATTPTSRGAVAEVARLDVDAHVVGRPQLVGQRVEALLAARAERQVVAALRELARELGADPGGGAGDEDRGAERGGREGHTRILACGGFSA